jgi:Uma2 family endonuclease
MAFAAASARDDDRPTDDQVVVLENLVWADWRRMIEARGDRSVPRMAFIDGALELMSPSRDHERIGSILARLAEAWAEHVGLEIDPLGSWTLEHAPRAGIEPDECFEIGEPFGGLPDLAIEVIWTSGRLSKLEAYRALGVPEVWVWRNETLRVYVLGSEGYAEADASTVLPGIDLQLVVTLLGERSMTAAVRKFRASF